MGYLNTFWSVAVLNIGLAAIILFVLLRQIKKVKDDVLFTVLLSIKKDTQKQVTEGGIAQYMLHEKVNNLTDK